MITPREAQARKLRLKREKAKRDAEKSLAAFTKQSWKVIEQGREYKHNWHIDVISEHLEAVMNRQIRNLIINIPPRHMKSTLVSVTFPAWVWGPHNKPSECWMFGSYSPKLSVRDAVKARRIIESPWYLSNWGDRFAIRKDEVVESALRPDQNEKMRYENTKSGIRISTSIGGTGTGDGGDIIVVDDPHKVKAAESIVQRSGVITWWDDEMSTRGNDPMTVCKIVVMQRVHDKDLCGHLKEKGNYEELILPFEYEPKIISYSKGTALGDRDPRKKEGELLWKNRFDKPAVDDLKKSLSSYQRSGQLQQRPTPKEGANFKRLWFKKRWRELPPMKKVINTWDLTFKGDDTSAFNVGYALGEAQDGADGKYYVIEEIRRKMDIIKQLQYLPRLKKMVPNTKEMLVENAANAQAAVGLLKRKITGIILVNPIGSKEDRADAVSYLFESGDVIFPDNDIKPWAEEAVEEFISFGPKAAYKDRVDALVHGLERFDKKRNVTTAVPDSITKVSAWAMS